MLINFLQKNNNSLDIHQDIITCLAGIWQEKPLKTIMLYGERKMGKSSILLALANSNLSQVKLVYLDLTCLGSVSWWGEILLAISDSISEALNIAPIEYEALIKSPELIFKKYLSAVLQNQDRFNLILALDEFEYLEELITNQEVPQDFCFFLNDLLKEYSNFGLIFAGLHTLEEMTTDYFRPFLDSCTPIQVSFLSPADTRLILTNPYSDFLLDYTDEALDLIYYLTRGQAFLVQAIGFQLIQIYQDYPFEQGLKRPPTLTGEDIKAVINQEFFSQNRYYFTGVWKQTAKKVETQQAILKALADYPEGLNKDDLLKITKLGNSTFLEAVKRLKRHDIIEETHSKYRIIVELFRLWLSDFTFEY